jgi:hypothetical protein
LSRLKLEEADLANFSFFLFFSLQTHVMSLSTTRA